MTCDVRPSRWFTLFATAAILAAQPGCSSDESSNSSGAGGAAAPACAPNSCNESHEGGTCDDSSGQIVCTCSAGYIGASCTTCADGYDAQNGACVQASCQPDSCNQANKGGTCDDSSGHVMCTCAEGYMGSRCDHCVAGYHPDGQGACAHDKGTPCAPSPNDQHKPVQKPVLRQTLAASWDENWFASPAVADLDGDGKPEIIAARHSVLYVWDGAGKLKWRAAWAHNASEDKDHGGSRMWASPAVGDFNGDGKLEIAVASDADSSSKVNVAVYDYNGELLAGWPQHFGGSDEVRSITAGDLDGDGKYEIIVNKTNKGPATAVYELNGKLRAGWPEVNHGICDPAPPAEACWDFGGYNQNIGVADMDGDGKLDVISSYDAIGFGIFHDNGKPFPTDKSFKDRVVTSVEAYHDLKLSQQGWGTGDRSEFTYSPPVMADMDRDGDLELMLVGDHEHTKSTENKGVTYWMLEPDMTRPKGWESPKDTGMPLAYGGKLGQNIVSTRPSPSIGQLDDEPTLEFMAPAYDGKLYVFNTDGTQAWTYTYGTKKLPYTGMSEALIADLNRDGVPEVVFTTFSSGEPRKPDVPAHLVILNNNGAELFKVEIPGRGSMAAPTIADIDGDGQPELIISLKDTLGGGKGGVQIWDLPGAEGNCMQWPTGRGGMLRQGRYGAM